MSLASTSHLSLCSSPPLPPRSALAKQQNHHPLLFSPTKNFSGLSTSSCFLNTHLVRLSVFVVKASETESKPAESGSEGGGEGKGKPEAYEEYEVEVVQPYGLKFSKGRDGGTYIDAIAPGGSADKTGKFTVGDKVVATSAVFGDEIWPAAEYGRTMYTIRQRIGPLLMRMQKRYGNLDTSGELTEKEIIRAERNSGVISGKLRDIQVSESLFQLQTQIMLNCFFLFQKTFLEMASNVVSICLYVK
ncbi:unnamed protein product [Malus baccata var. baccata]